MSKPATWRRQLRLRFAAHWRVKMAAIPAFAAGFFILYFRLLNHPLFPVAVMPLTAIDRLVGFAPLAMLPYVSLWPYVLLMPALLLGRREAAGYVAAVVAVAAVGLGIFLFWPTAIPRLDIDWSRHPSFEFLKRVDAAGNACPSLHVAFTVLTAVWLERLLRQIGAPAGLRFLSVVWAIAIVYSTLATKQHVAVDVFAGAALGLAGALIYFRPAAAEAPLPAAS